MRKEQEQAFGGAITRLLEEQGRTIQQLADGIGVKYEMARRYKHGLSIPKNPKTLEAMASFFGVSIGALLVDGDDGEAVIQAATLTEPVHDSTVVELADDAMLVLVDGIRLFGKGDHVILSPARPRNGDIVAVQVGKGATLRRLQETEACDLLVPANKGFDTLRGEQAAILGVVSEVRGRSKRFS